MVYKTFKSWLWTCIFPTLLSAAVFIVLFLSAYYRQVSWLPLIIVIWGSVSVSATFILNSLASFLLTQQSRTLQLFIGIVLALIVPLIMVVIDQS